MLVHIVGWAGRCGVGCQGPRVCGCSRADRKRGQCRVDGAGRGAAARQGGPALFFRWPVGPSGGLYGQECFGLHGVQLHQVVASSEQVPLVRGLLQSA